MTVDEVLDVLWVRGVGLENAGKVLDELSTEELQELDNFFRECDLSLPEVTFEPRAKTARSKLLFLAAFAKHHSDSLVMLPGELRKLRIEALAAEVGLSPELVSRAARLGPYGIEKALGTVKG
jgi:hypothetical protein